MRTAVLIVALTLMGLELASAILGLTLVLILSLIFLVGLGVWLVLPPLFNEDDPTWR